MKALLLSFLLLMTVSYSFGQDSPEMKPDSQSVVKEDSTSMTKEIKPLVTFVELGSVTCIPCKQMQPVMKAIEAKYCEQVKVVFYDVWKAENKKYSEQYKIRLIPTQVFLDEKGKEFFRHEGFYPEAEIDKLMQGKGAKPKPSTKG